MSKRIGFDVGGTFTDFILADTETGERQIYKRPTTDDPSDGVMANLNAFINETGTDWTELDQMIHATTLATNTVLERDGAETALVVTEGFRDVSILGRQKRYDLYDMFIEKPDPIVPREDIYEVSERIHPREGVVTELNEAQVKKLASDLAEQYEAVAVSLLHSYKDDRHERRVAELLGATEGNLSISRASNLSGLFREYERTNTAAVDAYIKPRINQYIADLTSALNEQGYSAPFYLMKSSGGVGTPEMIRDQPVQVTESGPVAGALNSARLGKQLGFEDVFSFDMGGTTAKICFIVDGEPERTDVFEVDEMEMKQGSGIPINLSVIDMIEISAGGGSIASVEETGTISVGPESAGADPGPICYGFGGDRPTVTDADLVLGYLNPDYFLGGEMNLTVDEARAGIKAEVAAPLNVDVETAAWGVKQVVDNSMMQASRIHASERGLDLRSFGMIAFGGAGPMHAAFIARDLNVPRVIVPTGAGVASATGLLVADIEFHLQQSDIMPLEPAAMDDINDIFETLEAEGRALVRDASEDAVNNIEITRSADMKYIDQAHDINVPLPTKSFGPDDFREIQQHFTEQYERTYGYSDPEESIEGVTWKVTVRAPTTSLKATEPNHSATSADDAWKGTREAYFDRTDGFTECDIYDREHLGLDTKIEGPAIIEETNSTTVLPPRDVLKTDERGNLLIEVHQ